MVEVSTVNTQKINNFLKYRILTLNKRTQNNLLKILDNKIEFATFFEKISDKNYISKEFSSITLKSVKDIEKLYQNVLSFYEHIGSHDSNDNVFISNNKLLMSIFPVLEKHLYETKGTNNRYLLFRLIDILLKLGFILDERSNYFFEFFFPFRMNVDKQNLTELAKVLNVSRERSRQYFNIIKSTLSSSFLFINNLQISSVTDYQIEGDRNLIIIDSLKRDEINSIEGTDFTNTFICLIFSVILDDSHEMFSYKDKSGKLLLKNGLLIKRNITKVFDFNTFISQTAQRVRLRTEQEYTIEIDEYLSDFIKSNDIGLHQEVRDTAIQILLSEFELKVHQDAIIFGRTTGLYNWEYAKIALQQLGVSQEGQNLVNILSYLRDRFPEERFSESAIRNAIIAEKNVFITFSKTSSYGLKIWETLFSNIKGGTITEMVIERLNKSEEPIHIHELFEYVKIYRNSAIKRSILENLKSPTRAIKQDLIIQNGFVGLRSKGHHNKISSFKRISGSMLTTNILKKFHNAPKATFISHFLQKGLKSIQIESILYDKALNSEITINEHGRIIISSLKHNYNIEPSITIFKRESKKSLDDIEQDRIMEYYQNRLTEYQLREALSSLQGGEDNMLLQNSTKFKRDNQIIALIKLLRKFKCQICNCNIKTKGNGLYIEAAHIIPKHMGGCERAENIILLCPNHHKEFDYGDLIILEHNSEYLRFYLNDNYYHINLSLKTDFN